MTERAQVGEWLLPRLFPAIAAVLLLSALLRTLQQGTFFETAVWGPITEETFKFLSFVLLATLVRSRGGLGTTWRGESPRLIYYAASVGILFAGYEFLTSYYGEPYEHRLLRFAAHPTYTLVAVTASLHLWRQGRAGAHWWSIALAATVHGLFNSSDLVGLGGARQWLIIGAAMAVLLPALYRMVRWESGPETFRRLTTPPRKPERGMAQVVP